MNFNLEIDIEVQIGIEDSKLIEKEHTILTRLRIAVKNEYKNAPSELNWIQSIGQLQTF